MPIYEYQCPQCQAVFEEWLTVSDAVSKNTASCPNCSTVSPHIISNTAFVLKGGGWYVTEYGNKKDSAAQECASQSSEAASEKTHGDSAQEHADGKAQAQTQQESPKTGENTSQKADAPKSSVAEKTPATSQAIAAQKTSATQTRAAAS